jgi:hypothetical protein
MGNRKKQHNQSFKGKEKVKIQILIDQRARNINFRAESGICKRLVSTLAVFQRKKTISKRLE